LNGLVGRTISHYHILEQIGQGGMSSVFRAVDLDGDRAVAIKILSPYIAHEARFQARFEREIKLLRRLQHPHIIPILDFGEADGLAFIVMPFISSGTLLDRLRQGPLDPAEGGRIVDQLASALTLAHENGVIHRDVKPSNVLLDPQGNALLSDFSFARPQEASQNLTGSALIGTPAYMSPEQCRGDAVDARSDQYSFGVMLYQIATGRLPFEGDTPMAVALMHVNVPLPRPREVNPNLPVGIEQVLIKALAKDPANRYESIRHLNDAFQHALRVAVDPARRAAEASTQLLDRTLAMYRKYQNVRPPTRRRWYERSALVAALLLLTACAVSAGAIAVIRPEIFSPAAAASSLSEAEIQATVEFLLALNAPQAGSGVSEDELATAIMAAVMQTVAAGQSTAAPGEPTSTLAGSPTPTIPGGIIFPTLTPTPTGTLKPGETPPTSTPTPSPSRTPTPTDTGAVTPTNTDVPTATPQPTDTREPTINPNACKSTPSHPNYCTPTP